MVPTERCERHHLKTVDMFCQNHDIVGCGTCIAVDHRACQDVFYIPEIVKSRANVIPEFLQCMKNIGSKFKEFLKTFSDEVDALKANKQRELETVKTFAKKIKEKIKEAERDAITKVEERYEKLMVKMNEDIDNIKREMDNFETTKGFIESTVGNNSETFVAMKLNGNKIAKAEAASHGIAQIQLGRRVHFTLDPKFEEMSKERMCLGNVKIMPYSFEYKGTVDIKLDSDAKPCNVYGSCVLSDGSIVFADNSNKNLKLVDGVALTVLDYYNLKTEPWDMCCLDDKEVGVCLKNEKKVKFFKVDHHQLVYKYELSFSFGLYNRTIFVTDPGKGVICLDNSGHVLNTVTSEIGYAHGLAAAYDVKVFACGWMSENVILLNEKGEFENGVIEKGLTKPQALCFSCNNGRLYVPNWKSDSVQIFELE
ncbi:uncharacterized protein LOC123532975 [Mercenaria mercenaria]|uniref:uncharacterized protein LOC123532975 n=1 Tax=Mercenaria mercenaria TaxID=6596 RepID=UPI00234E944B|nr:uncharacterized protein LOC123532975 [Mercenaria mercenaria]